MELIVVNKDNISEIVLKRLMELDQLMGDLHWTSTAWIQLMLDLPKYFLVIAIDDERNSSPIMAFALFLRVEQEQLAHLLKIVVDSHARSQGLAQKLLQGSIDVLKQQGFQKIYLEVAEKNVAAIALYEKLQFELLHRCRNFYGLRRDAYKMALELRKKEKKEEDNGLSPSNN